MGLLPSWILSGHYSRRHAKQGTTQRENGRLHHWNSMRNKCEGKSYQDDRGEFLVCTQESAREEVGSHLDKVVQTESQCQRDLPGGVDSRGQGAHPHGQVPILAPKHQQQKIIGRGVHWKATQNGAKNL